MPNDDDLLRVVVRACQQSQAGLLNVTDPTAAALCRGQYRVWLERLYVMLGTDLEGMLQQMQPADAQDSAVIALNLFSSVVNALPELQLDREVNLRAFLLHIALAGSPCAPWRAAPADTQSAPASCSIDATCAAPPACAQIDRRILRPAPANGHSLGSRAISALHQHARPVVDRIMHELRECERLFQEYTLDDRLPGCQH